MKDKDLQNIWESYVSEKKDKEKTVTKDADVNDNNKLDGWEKARADKIAANDDDPDTHVCATKLKHEQYGVGTPITARHAQPDQDGHVSWYAVMFEHGTEVVDTVDVTILDETNHGSHKKKKRK